MRFTTGIIIRRPVSEVFRYVCDPKYLPEWVQGFETYRREKGRRRREGSRGVQVYKEPDGKMTEVEEEVLVREEGEELELLLQNRNMLSRVRYRFYNQGGEVTKLIVDVETKLRPYIFNLISPFVKGPMLRRQRADLQRLKQVLEE